jgi:methionine-gamma-lyase
MPTNPARQGLGTLVNHLGEDASPHSAHLMPIYQTSIFRFSDVNEGRGIVSGNQPGYYYTRLGNPNLELVGRVIAALEGLDLLRANPDSAIDDIVAGRVFASGMAAITSVIMALTHSGDTIIAQENVYSNTYTYLRELAPRLGLQIAWVKDTSLAGWEAAFHANPGAVLAYAETPTNPTLWVVDLQMVAELVHEHGCWLVVDNTFASPYCQRPLSLGADVVVHSTTKYLSGHGAVIGGAAVSRHMEFVRDELQTVLKLYGSVPSPFDSWLVHLGLKTFELRMQRHCENASRVARYLEAHPKVAAVHYPGLESHPCHEIAIKQMHAFGGMLSFELKDGYRSGEELMNRVRLATLAVSLGNVDTLIEHPASMTHFGVPPEERLRAGISEGLVRFSVGIENIEDILEDLEQGLEGIG